MPMGKVKPEAREAQNLFPHCVRTREKNIESNLHSPRFGLHCSMPIRATPANRDFTPVRPVATAYTGPEPVRNTLAVAVPAKPSTV